MDFDWVFKNVVLPLLLPFIGAVMFIAKLGQRTSEVEKEVESVKKALRTETEAVRAEIAASEERRETRRKEDIEREERRFSEVREDVQGIRDDLKEILRRVG